MVFSENFRTRLWTAVLAALLWSLSGATVAANSALANDYFVHVWRSEEGLPQNSVTCLAQTPDGYLWIGTRSGGLARFDGLRFVVFTPQNTPELLDVEIEILFVDSEGVLWITMGNESITTFKDGKFRVVRTRHAPPRWHAMELVGESPDSVVFSTFRPALFSVPRDGPTNAAQPLVLSPPWRGLSGLCQGANGNIWYLSADGTLCRATLGASGESASTMIDRGRTFHVLVANARKEVWAATDSRIGQITGDAFVDLTPTNGPAPSRTQRLVPTGEAGLWVWEADRLRRMEGGEWVAEAADVPAPETPDLRLFGDSQGGLWGLRYGEGLLVVRPDGQARTLTREDGLPSALISCWLEDTEGNIWIGTRDGGLARIRRRFFKAFSEADGIPGAVVQSVCEDPRGTLWVGTTTGGLAYREGDRFVQVPLLPLPRATIESVTVFPDAANGVWIGTVNGGVMRYMNGVVTRPFPLGRGPGRTTDVVLQDQAGRVWMGNGSGLFVWQDGRVDLFGRRQGFLEGVGVRALAEGPPGTLWIGTGPGELWQLTDGLPICHRPPPEWPAARISALLPDNDGVVWVGTLGGGLLRFENGKFTRITSKHGLPDDSVTQLLEDDEGNLWGGTYAGVFRAAKSDLKAAADGTVARIPCPVYGRLDGLPAQECSGWYQPACWRSPDGKLWFTTVKGLAMLDTLQIAVNRRPPPVVIEEFLLDGVPRDFSSGLVSAGKATKSKAGSLNASPLMIEPGRHYVEFRFTGLNFTAPDKVRFRWKLEGVEDRWREGGSQRVVGPIPLQPGNYRFRVLAANNDGVWNEEGATLAFTVLPHFWETWWFKSGLGALGLVLFAGAISMTMRRRHRVQLERLERMRELERERSRIAQDLHDDLGTSLTQINMLSGLVSHQNTPPSEVKELTRQIRATSREMVSELNEIVWAVNPKNDTLTELLGYLGNFAESFCRSTPLRCRLKFTDSLPDVSLSSEVRHNVFLAFKEAVNNAVKHSGADELWIRANVETGMLVLSVEDNGKGLAIGYQAPGTGHGLANMRQRLDRIGGQCSMRPNGDQGTVVEFRIPLE